MRGIRALVESLKDEDACSKSLGISYLRDAGSYTVTTDGLPNLIRAASGFVNIWLSKHSFASLQLNQRKRVLFELMALFGDHCTLKWGINCVIKHFDVSYVHNEHYSIAYFYYTACISTNIIKLFSTVIARLGQRVFSVKWSKSFRHFLRTEITHSPNEWLSERQLIRLYALLESGQKVCEKRGRKARHLCGTGTVRKGSLRGACLGAHGYSHGKEEHLEA